MEQAAFIANIHGIVQGVGFRYFTLRKARAWAIRGYVKNIFDGTVEVYAEGDKIVLEKFLKEIRSGPSGATVERIEIDWLPPGKQCLDFRIEY